VFEPTACARTRSCPDPCYCSRCDALVGLDGFHVLEVDERAAAGGPWLRVVVGSPAREEGCRSCGAVAHSHGRRMVRLVDTPCFGRPVGLVWRKRAWRCAEPGCSAGSFTEQHHDLARPRALLTARAAGGPSTRCAASTRRWPGSLDSSAPPGAPCDARSSPCWRRWQTTRPRFEGAATLGVDEHVWHHVSTKPEDQGGRGPKEPTAAPKPSTDSSNFTRRIARGFRNRDNYRVRMLLRRRTHPPPT
jgi:transposase